MTIATSDQPTEEPPDTEPTGLVESEPIEQSTFAQDQVEPATPTPTWRARPEPITVRATVNLSGLRAGDHVRVDPTDPYTRELIERGYLVEE